MPLKSTPLLKKNNQLSSVLYITLNLYVLHKVIHFHYFAEKLTLGVVGILSEGCQGILELL